MSWSRIAKLPLYPSGNFLVFSLGCAVGGVEVEVADGSVDGAKEASMA